MAPRLLLIALLAAIACSSGRSESPRPSPDALRTTAIAVTDEPTATATTVDAPLDQIASRLLAKGEANALYLARGTGRSV